MGGLIVVEAQKGRGGGAHCSHPVDLVPFGYACERGAMLEGQTV